MLFFYSKIFFGSAYRVRYVLGILLTHKKKAGFTLLETVVALGIIVSGVASAFSLSLQGVTNVSTGKNKLIAMNLAEEGLEIMRKIRDDNELKGVTWDTGIFPSLPAPCPMSWKVDINSVSGALQTYDATYLGYDASNGLYYYNGGLPNSVFQREIQVEKPNNCMSGKRTDIPDAAQMRIRSIVRWNERTVAQSVSLEEALYDWK